MFEEYESQPSFVDCWFSPSAAYVRARWIFLRALGAIFFSAFYALWFQIHGLIGSRGVLPADAYLHAAKNALGAKAYWLVPSLLWINSSDGALTAIVIIGALASIALLFNLWPRLSITVAGLCFLSFVAAAQDFSSYQSDGMLLEAAFLSLFFAPRGVLPGLDASRPPTRAALFLLKWEWFRIYFESGLVKILSGEPQWRNLTAMDKYYENSPLPTWIAWYVQQFPHAFHAFTAGATLAIELFICWLAFFPSRWARVAAFVITSALQIGIILTGNYAFLNYLVLALGVLLLDDEVLGAWWSVLGRKVLAPSDRRALSTEHQRSNILVIVVLTSFFLTSIIIFFVPSFPLAVLVEPARIVNNFGLFAVMTRARYEIEFQGTRDGRTWIAYPFRYKPQDVKKRPGMYAPYQPRFDWNLWFASLGSAADNSWVMNAEARLLENSEETLGLFAGNPFAASPPIAVRTVMWQYWFTTSAERAKSGAWWKRELIGPYAPTASRAADGSIQFQQNATEQ